MKKVAAAAVVAVALAGCSGPVAPEEQSTPTPAPTVTVTRTATPEPSGGYGDPFTPTSLDDLREELVEVGLDCGEWQEVLVEDVAAQCDDVILATFVGDSAEEQAFLQESVFQTWTAVRETEGRDVAVLMGTNYSVRMYVEQAEVLQPYLGGVVLA